MSAFLCSDTHFDILVSYFAGEAREDGLYILINKEGGYES